MSLNLEGCNVEIYKTVPTNEYRGLVFERLIIYRNLNDYVYKLIDVGCLEVFTPSKDGFTPEVVNTLIHDRYMLDYELTMNYLLNLDSALETSLRGYYSSSVYELIKDVIDYYAFKLD